MNPIRAFLRAFRRGVAVGFVSSLARRGLTIVPTSVVSGGKALPAAGSTPLAELEANRAEAEADLMHASQHLRALLIARADAELTEAIGRWSLGLSHVVDLSAAVKNAKEVTVR